MVGIGYSNDIISCYDTINSRRVLSRNCIPVVCVAGGATGCCGSSYTGSLAKTLDIGFIDSSRKSRSRLGNSRI